jgi:CDP-paratose 2-epimerase
VEQNRIGDHIWWISDLSRFREHYPEWRQQYDVRSTLQEIFHMQSERQLTQAAS